MTAIRDMTAAELFEELARTDREVLQEFNAEWCGVFGGTQAPLEARLALAECRIGMLGTMLLATLNLLRQPAPPPEEADAP